MQVFEHPSCVTQLVGKTSELLKILCIFLWEFPACRTSSLKFIVKVKCLWTQIWSVSALSLASLVGVIHSVNQLWYELTHSSLLDVVFQCQFLFLGVNSRERHRAPCDVCALKFAILPKMLFHSCSGTALPDALSYSCGRKETSEWLFDSSALVLFLGLSNLPGTFPLKEGKWRKCFLLNTFQPWTENNTHLTLYVQGWIFSGLIKV